MHPMLGVLLVLITTSLAAGDNGPTWAKDAVKLRSCEDPASAGASRLTSPDGAIVVQAECGASESLTLRVRAFGRTHLVPLRDRSVELLWAPGSRAFLINGSESASAGFFVDVFELGENGVARRSVDRRVQMDMVDQFPPCRAANADEHCREIAANPQFNVSGIAWTRGASALIVVAEVPCSSRYGGIMCQVRGYEVAVADGRILREMSPQALKREWQPRMAWPMRIPEPPMYERR